MAVEKKEKRVEVRLPRLGGVNANPDEFYSVNFKNYLVRRGVTVEVPEPVANVIQDNEQAEEYALRYIEETKQKTPQ